MVTVPKPDTETKRLESLNILELLDRSNQSLLDRLTRLAATVFNTPIALALIIDKDQHWLTSSHGLTEQAPISDLPFHTYTLQQEHVLVVEDTLLDPRFTTNTWVNGPAGIRFYAGVPVLSNDGTAVGALCVMDTQPRTISDTSIQALTDLASLASDDIQRHELILRTKQHIQQVSEELRVNEDMYQSFFEQAGTGLALQNQEGRWVNVNNAFCEILGYSKHEICQLHFSDITHPDDLDKDRHLQAQIKQGRIDRYQLEKRYIKKSGEVVWVHLNTAKKLDHQGKLEYYIDVIKDITARKNAEASLATLRHGLEVQVAERTQELTEANHLLSQALKKQLKIEQALRQSEEQLRAVLANANDGYLCFNSAGVVVFWNPACSRILGWGSEEAIGKRLDQLIVPPERVELFRKQLHLLATKTSPFNENKRSEAKVMRKDGNIIPVELSIYTHEVNDEYFVNAFLHDITERKSQEETREHEARHDQLTGLYNRRAIFESLPQLLAIQKDHRHTLAILFMDLDGFKTVNDSYGHSLGDNLLIEVAQRLSEAVRQTDMVGRLGGDEFIILVQGLAHPEHDVERIGNKLIDVVSSIRSIEGYPITIGASIGIALCTGPTESDPDTLISLADNAMYEAKRHGKGRVVVVSTGGQKEATNELPG